MLMEERHIIKVGQLGLAAYLKLNLNKEKATLIEVTKKHFIFDSLLSIHAWRIIYANSESKEHDNEVCELREIRRNIGTGSPND